MFMNQWQENNSYLNLQKCIWKNGVFFSFLLTFCVNKMLYFILIKTNSRSIRPLVFCKKCVLKNFAKFTENTCVGVTFLIKSQLGLHVLSATQGLSAA